QQNPHNLLKPLPLISDSRGRRVIPFDHFINNDLEYLRGGASRREYTTSVTKTKATDYGHIKWIEDLVPRTMWIQEPRRVILFDHFINNDLEYLHGGASRREYTTSVTKTKATDYGHIKWIEDLVPRTMWIQEPIGYDKHARWGISIGGVNVSSSTVLLLTGSLLAICILSVESPAVTELKIVEWHNYKHLDQITVRSDDDKLYKLREGDFKRLRMQDIEDMLLLLVQGKLTNLTFEERFAFNNKDKQNRLMRRDWNKMLPATHESIQQWISELVKQSDSRSSFNELIDTPMDFSNFLINRLIVDILTSELLAGPTYELMKGSCKSLVDLEFFLEEVYKATTDQLDWVNLEGPSQFEGEH
nr:hypothetical protein [Tanacetum cinerariifolium]